MNRRPDAAERLIELRTLESEAEAAKLRRRAAERRLFPTCPERGTVERLKYAWTKGIGDYLKKICRSAEGIPRCRIIEGPLMAGMNCVGDRF